MNRIMSKVTSITVWCDNCDSQLPRPSDEQDTVSCSACERRFASKEVLKAVRYRVEQARVARPKGGAVVDDVRDPLYSHIEGLSVKVGLAP
ncbi:MAG: hypothetical protein OXQ32_08080 [bacterium]|nr:hypothetical protein [bacterium]